VITVKADRTGDLPVGPLRVADNYERRRSIRSSGEYDPFARLGCLRRYNTLREVVDTRGQMNLPTGPTPTRRSRLVTFAVPLLLILLPTLVAEGSARWSALAAGTVGVAVAVVAMRWRDRGRGRDRRPADADAHQPYLVPRELPPSSPVFVGREKQVRHLLDLLAPGPDGPRVIVIDGIPGIGKTTLAVQVAHAAADRFPDGQLFAEAGTRDGTPTDEVATRVLTYFISALSPAQAQIPTDLAALLGRFRALTADQRVLFILDDLASADLLRTLLPAGSGCAVLVTSREGAKLGIPAERVLSLGGLAAGESLELIGAIAGSHRFREDRDRARQITEITGGHPLSIRTAGAGLAATPHSSLETALRRWEELPSPSGAQPGRLLYSLDLSYALLTAEERAAVRALGLLDRPAFEPWRLAALLDSDEASVERRAERLGFAGFAERTSVDSVGIVLFLVPEHVQLYAQARRRSELTPAEQAAALDRLAERSAARRATDPVGRLRADVFDAVSEGRLLEAIRAAREAVALARENANPVAEGLALAAFAEVRAELGSFDPAEDLARMALADEVRTDLAEARARRCLGRLHRRLRQLDRAVTELDAALVKAAQDVDEQIQVLRELAVARALAGRPDEARAAVERALELIEADPGQRERLRAGVCWAASVVHEEAGRLAESEQAMDEGYAAAVALRQELWVAWLRHRAAHLELHRPQAADLQRVRQRAREAVDIFGRINHRYGKAYGRLVLGEASMRERRFGEAVPQLEEANENFLNCGDRWAEAESARLLALARGMTAESERLLRMAGRVFTDLGDTARATLVEDNLTGLGTTAPERGVPGQLLVAQRTGS
jgi:tetratricopeptide (TPR) repeat protein